MVHNLYLDDLDQVKEKSTNKCPVCVLTFLILLKKHPIMPFMKLIKRICEFHSFDDFTINLKFGK